MTKALIVTAISGFLPQFEMNDVHLLQEMGCEVHYASDFDNPVYRCDEEQLKGLGIRLHRIDVDKSPRKLFRNLRAAVQIKRLIDEEGIALVHCHNPMGGVTARLGAWLSRRKPFVLYTAHGLHFYRKAPIFNWIAYYPAECLMARLTDAMITINREDYKNARRLHLRRRGAVAQIHGVGVDGNRFRPQPETAAAKREELGIPADAVHIVTAAELNDNKNQRVIIEALARLGNENIYYSICGKGPNRDRLEALIRRHGLEQRVKLLGYRTDMEEILRTADIFAFPSRREGLGVAAVEALLTGVPLIAADNRGTREYARRGHNALICRADRVEDYVEAIRLLAEDRGLRDELAERCRASAGAFTLEEVEKSMRRVYRRVLKTIGG